MPGSAAPDPPTATAEDIAAVGQHVTAGVNAIESQLGEVMNFMQQMMLVLVTLQSVLSGLVPIAATSSTAATIAPTTSVPFPATTPHSSSGLPSTAKPRKLEEISGKNVDAISTWFKTAFIHLHLSNISADTNNAVIYVTQYFAPPLSEWFDTVKTRANNSLSGGLHSVKELQDLVAASFFSLPVADRARDAIMNCKQRTSVQDYANTFTSYLNHLPDRSVKDNIWAFKNGLKPYVKSIILLRPSDCTTLESTINLALTTDAIAFNERHQQPSTNRAATTNNRFQPLRQTPSSASPMDLGNVDAYEVDSNEEDEEEMAELAAVSAHAALTRNPKPTTQTCYKCGTAGHIAINCTSTTTRKPRSGAPRRKPEN